MPEFDPSKDMSQSGWYKEVVWQDIREESGSWLATPYLFRATDFRCPRCDTTDFTWVVPQRAGIYIACMGCRIVNGPITLERAVGGGPYGETKELTPEEVKMIFDARGTRIPVRLARQLIRRRPSVKRPPAKDVKIY